MSIGLRVLLAEDHPLYRRALVALCAAQQGWSVVGECANGEQAIAGAQEHQPDVVVMDLHMPGVDGIEATRRIAAASPHIAVLVLTMQNDDDSVFAAMRAGARGYLLKDADQADIVRAITAVGRGEAIFGPAVAHRIVEFFAAPRPAPVAAFFPELTAREHEVLDLVAAGRSNSQITEALSLSPKTVRNHLSNIFTKLRVADRSEAIIRARDSGMGR
jgi:DNA-binding NarL/FixJ family response regulator